MKFLCDRCKTKYSIADEKVRRKILKIRCKNCTNIITVRDPDAKADAGSKPSVAQKLPLENALSSAFSESMDGEATALATNLPEFRPEAMGIEEEWYYANAGQQLGPVPFGQLAMMVERAQVKEDSFIWRDGFEDWLRADGVPELRPFFKKRAGTPAPSTKALPKREVPRPTDGKLAGKKPTPAAGLPAGGGIKIEEKQAGRPKFDLGEDELPDMSDSLEMDDNDSGELPTTASEPLGESVSDAVSGLFAKADDGKVPDRKSVPPQSSKEEHSDGMGLDLNISEPSRIVKLDAILAAGAAARTGKQSVNNSTGEVFKLPGLSDDVASEAVAISQTGPHSRPVLPAMPYAQPAVMLAHRDHKLYKMLAIGGGVMSLLLIVVVVMLLHPGGGTKTIVIEKEKSPEDIGAEFAEQIAREEAAKKFGPIAAINKRNVDSIPPAHGAGGPPPRRSTMPPQPPHKVAGGTPGKTEDQRLADLYGSTSGPNHASTPSASRPAEDSLEPFKRGAKLCLDRALKKDPSLQTAKIDVKISITAVGGVSGVSIPSPYREQFVGQCLSGVIKHLPWPSRGNAYDIDMPLLLSGG